MTVNTGTMDTGDKQSDMSRREFLNYAWLATLGILTVQLGIVTLAFAMPRLGPGEFGGPVPLGNVDALPPEGAPPTPYNRAKFWWVNSANGTLAIYKVCTHLGCIYDWKAAEIKFICPCHGSQFSREGEYLAGPAPRGLDRFVIRALDSSGTEVARTDESGGPVMIPAGSNVIVETGLRIQGTAKA